MSRRTRLLSLLAALSPYLTLLALFATFILWNGGVVLGDKSNHIATLHLPQLLYLWPLITFFSWPHLYPYLLTLPFWLLTKTPGLNALETNLIFRRRQLTPRPWLFLLCTLLAALAVHYNTIIHPFTLADNRHYTFYIFRLLLRRPWTKYAVTPIYVACAWSSIQALGARPPPSPPSAAPEAKSTTAALRAGEHPNGPHPLDLPNGTLPAKTSFVLIWLATSALQLVTAPLVEPRYFILPWMFWRLHLPLQRSGLQVAADAPEEAGTWRTWIAGWDHRMLLETAWLATINLATCYIFLTWEFRWPQEPGTTQRFMW